MPYSSITNLIYTNLSKQVGLQAEEAKEPGPGAGLCPGYTISRAILADAVALSRGDRFMTTEMTRKTTFLTPSIILTPIPSKQLYILGIQ